jgi:hypothetical protein
MNAPRIFCLITAFTAATGLLTPGNAVSAQTYTAAAGFSPTSNPSGTWSYGYSATRGGPYSYFTVHGSFAADGTGAPLDYWSAAVPESGPNVVHNATGAPQILGGTAAMNPDALVIGAGGDYIGPTNVYAVARFIVPSTAAYALNVLFEGIQIAPTCSNGTTTDVHILLNGGSLFSGAVNGWVGRPYVASPPMGSAPSQSYTSVLALAAGDTVDFAIGNSGNGSSCDGTQLSAQLVTQQPSAVPEPSATAFGVSVAAFSLVLLRYRTARK